MNTLSGLPERRVRLFGREADAAAIRELLATSPGRLVTVIGTGGCGKTSLALELAHQAVPAFAEEGFWVELESCHEATAVSTAIAAVVGANLGEGSAANGLVAALRGRQALLVLDNCEQVVAAVAPLVDKLLLSCPDLRVLATSRAPLRVRGEHVYILEPLPVPEAAAGLEARELERSPSVALFLERSRAAGTRAGRNQADLRAVARICRRLDGLPLAIELAAAQTLLFSPSQLADRLDARLSLPLQPGHALPERQQTMEAALDWSYSLLSEADRQLFELTCAFTGSWTLEALESVASDKVEDAAGGLGRLVEASLVTTVDDGERRYRSLAPVHEYALSRAAARGVVEGARARHAGYYMARARTLTADQGRRPLRTEEVAAIRAEYDNIITAMDWAVDAGEKVRALRLAQSLWVYWRVSGQTQLGLERCRALLRAGLERADDRAMCHEMISNFLQLRGRQAEAIEQAERALELFRESGNVVGLNLCLGTLGELASETGDYPRAREYFNEGLSMQPEHQTWTRAIFLAGLGVAAYRAGDFEGANELLVKADAMLGTVWEMWYIGLVRIRLGCISRRRGQIDGAVNRIREGLVVLNQRAAAGEVAHGLEELAGVECDRRRFGRAVVMLGAAARLRELAGTPVAPADAPSVEQSTTAARRGLSESNFTSAWVRGRALSQPEAVALALTDDGPSSEPLSALIELTTREREVAGLVARGYTNHQIAEELVISDATARTHVERIRAKLGVHSRVAVARLFRTESSSE